MDAGSLAGAHQPVEGVEGIARVYVASTGQPNVRSHESTSQVGMIQKAAAMPRSTANYSSEDVVVKLEA